VNWYFQRCNAYYAGRLYSAASQMVAVNLTGYDVASVSVLPVSGDFSTAAVAVRWAHDLTGPLVDFSTAVTLNTSTRGSGLVGVVAPWLVLDVTTGAAADCFLDVMITARRSEIPTEVTV
jgi:hypothetical protein